jgi:hypothetical protein
MSFAHSIPGRLGYFEKFERQPATSHDEVRLNGRATIPHREWKLDNPAGNRRPQKAD